MPGVNIHVPMLISLEQRSGEGTFGAHARVGSLHDVHEGLVLLVLDIPTSPTRRTRRLSRDL